MYRWGVIGLSEGNGHPYSWSAIINGYDADKMEACGFRVIPRYLEQHETPDPRLKDFQVSSVYTQDIEVSRHIAETCNIGHVATSVTELANSVDGIIVARDDAETHLDFAEMLAPLAKPVFFDKPLGYSSVEVRKILATQAYEGQFWSASGLSYEPSVQVLREEAAERGLLAVDAHISGPWDRYAIHLFEPLLNAGIINSNLRVVSVSQSASRRLAVFEDPDNPRELTARVTCWSKQKYAVPPTLSTLYADGTNRTIVLSDTYEAFTCLLHEFGMICENKKTADLSSMIGAIKLIESVTS